MGMTSAMGVGTVVRATPAAGNGAAEAAWRARLLWGVGATLVFALATVAMTWPLAARLGSATPGGGDPLLQIWIARWVQHALLTDPLRLYDANIFHPFQNTLAYSDSNVPAAILAAPLFLLTGNAILAVNAVVLGTFVLAAGGVYALTVALTNNRAVGIVAGLAYAFLPYRFAHIFHLNQLGHAWTPWAIVALVLLVRRLAGPRRGAWGLAAAFGALVAIQVVTSFYVAFQLALVVGLALIAAIVVAPQARTPRFLAHLAVAGAVAAVIILPLALPYLRAQGELGLERTVGEAEQYSATPGSYLRATGPQNPWARLGIRGGSEDILFPGGVALAGAVLGLLAARRRPALTAVAVATGIIAFVISLGPTWQGATPLPYRFLFDHFPFFTAMRVPARFGVLVNFAVVILAASGFAWAWERFAWRVRPDRARLIGTAATALLAVLVLAELRAGPLALVAVDRGDSAAAPYRWLAEQPGAGAVMAFPIVPLGRDERPLTLEMYWSTLHWKPLVQGYSGFTPPATDFIQRRFIDDVRRPDGTVAERISVVTGENVGILQDLGVRYLLLHRRDYAREDWPIVIAQLEATGRAERAGDFGETTIYLVSPRPEGTPPRRASLAIVAPSLATPEQPWEPTVVARNATDGLVTLSTRGRLTLTTTWRDESGRIARRDTRPLNLPTLLPPGDLYCSARLCPAAAGDNAPAVAPLPSFHPERPGRYRVEFALSGDAPVTQTLDVEVSASLPAPEAEGPPLAFVGASADADSYAPGATLGLTLEWSVRRPPPEDYTLFAQLIGPDGLVWGQYDAPAGWTSHYTAAWLPGETVTLPWPLPLKPDAPPGQYQLLVGMYRRTPSGTERVLLRYPSGDATEWVVGEVTVR